MNGHTGSSQILLVPKIKNLMLASRDSTEQTVRAFAWLSASSV